jgi:hypothetical protein
VTKAARDQIRLLPDDASIDDSGLPTIVKNALLAAGLKTVGQVRETPDKVILRQRRIAKGRLRLVRNILG